MRFIPSFIVLATILAAGQVQAAVSSVDVTLGPKLKAKAADLGKDDLDQLAATLRATVENQLRRHHQFAESGGDHVTLVIEDAKPNHPTFTQQGEHTGLTYDSPGLGGAQVTGTLTSATGMQTPLHEGWFETYLPDERGTAIWTDAELVFDKIAGDISKQEAAKP